mgnify:CR=1 FL=1
MLYKTHFVISDFCISNVDIPEVIADRILLHHLIPMNIVQDATPFDVYPSYSVKGQPSGWRPYFWEIARGRSGLSQHTFGQRKKTIKDEKGGCDITCEDFENNKDELLQALIDNTDYIRFAVYKTFIHADYKNTHPGRRLLFDATGSRWKFKKFIE